MRVLVDGEAEQLTRRIEEKVDGCDRLRPGGQAAFKDWLDLRFRKPLEEDAEAGPDYSKAFNLISVLTIAAGLSASVLADSAIESPATIGLLGLAVGVLTGVNRIWNPSQRSVARYQAAYSLRREGWDFVHDLGRFKRLPADARVDAFMEEVGRIHRGVERIDEATSTAIDP
jgi:hypothetical protein